MDAYKLFSRLVILYIGVIIQTSNWSLGTNTYNVVHIFKVMKIFYALLLLAYVIFILYVPK